MSKLTEKYFVKQVRNVAGGNITIYRLQDTNVRLGMHDADTLARTIAKLVKAESKKIKESLLLYQQQLAGMVDLRVWHLMQTSSVSLHPSLKRGYRQRPHAPTVKRRQMHQAMATQPTFFLGRLSVSFPQVLQGDPPVLLLPLKLIMVGPAFCWGGG